MRCVPSLLALSCLTFSAPVVRASDAADPDASHVTIPARGAVEFRPTADERRVPERFRLTPGTFPYEAEYHRTSGPARVHKVRFPSPVTTDVVENNTVHGLYFQPEGRGPFPGVVVLHILGGDFPLSQTVANSLARRGVAALFVKMPYYGERRPKGSPRRMLSREPAESLENFTQAVLDIRRAAAWLGDRPEVDEDQLGVTGISLGGIMSALSAAGEPRFRKVAAYLGGANLPAALWALDHPEADEFRRTWVARGGTRESFIELLRPIDPAEYGDLLAGRTMLMVNAAHDEIIPRECTLALWEAAGRKPELVWLDAGHFTAALYITGEVERLGLFFSPRVRDAKTPAGG